MKEVSVPLLMTEQKKKAILINCNIVWYTSGNKSNLLKEKLRKMHYLASCASIPQYYDTHMWIHISS